MVTEPVRHGRVGVEVDDEVDLEVAEQRVEPLLPPQPSRTERREQPEEHEQVAGANTLVAQMRSRDIGLAERGTPAGPPRPGVGKEVRINVSRSRRGAKAALAPELREGHDVVARHQRFLVSQPGTVRGSRLGNRHGHHPAVRQDRTGALAGDRVKTLP